MSARDDFKVRFNANSDGYARFRPRYPQDLMAVLGDRIAAARGPASPLVIDAGCGTGIFTRQLAALLPADHHILGVEPAAAMRETAIGQSDGLGIGYREGTAEALPAGDDAAVAVTAATAAHWFDRPRFFTEAARVLAPGGVLAIIEYVRDVEQSPAAAAIEDFLRREGGPKAYRRPDYAAELGALDGFAAPEVHMRLVTTPLDPEGFVGLALSSSHANAVVARLGRAETEAALARIGAGLAEADGTIPYTYRFQLFIAQRLASRR